MRAVARLLSLLLLCDACAVRSARPSAQEGGPMRAWSVARGTWVDLAALDHELGSADFVLLGENHDHPLHHRLQAQRLAAIVDAGRRPSLVFEMIDVEQQDAVDVAGTEPDAIAQAVHWSESGWPPFELYRPIFEVAHRAGLRIVGGDLSDGEARSIVRAGRIPADLETLLASSPPDAGQLDAWGEEMREAHCGHLPVEMLEPMVQAQRSRDLRLAMTLSKAGEGVLIAGAGHVRKDRAVPFWLARLSPGRHVVSVGLVEEDERLTRPAEHPWPYDYVIFTPRLERPDPCEMFRKAR